MENFAEGFSYEFIQNTVEAERSAATQNFGEWGLGKLAEDPFLYRKIVFSNETHFWLDGYVNKQHSRFWSEDQPEACIRKKSQFGAV